MVNCLDVGANKLIEVVAKKLEDMKIEKPEFVSYVKSGSHAERPPSQDNFWYIRCASVMRHTFSQGKVGVNKMRRHYGGNKNGGVKPEHHKMAGGSILRKALQSLEKAGLMKKDKTGRVLTPEGERLLNQCAKDISKSQ